MALSELIKYEGDNTTFIWKYPNEDFNNMTELVVNESQEAIFFANGIACDTFGPGRYKLDSENIPILSKMIDKVTGVSIFHSQVYFINKTVQMAIKWGTDSRIRLIEPSLGIPVEIGASGEMNLSVSDGKKLLIKLVGTTNGIAWQDEQNSFSKSLQASFRPLISTAVKTYLPVVIDEREIKIVEIDRHLTDISGVLKEKIIPGFEEYGLTVNQLFLTNVILPEEDPNFRKLKELYTVSLQKKMSEAESEIRKTQAENKAIYMSAEAEAEAKIKAAQRKAVLEGQVTENEIAKMEAERKIIQAQAEAQAAQLAGFAEANIMQAKGYNQKDVLQAEVQKAYAEGIGNMGPSISSGGGSVMSDMLGLGVGMAAMNAMSPQVSEMMKGLNPNTTQNMACPKCGNQIPSGLKFCSYCGENLQTSSSNEVICPSCGKKSLPGKFCTECGSPLVKKCPKCGKEYPLNIMFCSDCGEKL